MKVAITSGQVSDDNGYAKTVDGDLPDTKVLIADKGYDSNAIREDIEANGAAVIPLRRNRKDPIPIDDFTLCPAQPHRALHQPP